MALSGVPTAAAADETLPFILHATFFSQESNQPKPLDPHAFVKDAPAREAVGPQNPNGVYSLFENHFDQKPIGFTPSDGTGASNSFTADANGSAAITLTSPQKPTQDNAVLLVYHSDTTAHGMQRGEIGVTAHHQIIVRIPA